MSSARTTWREFEATSDGPEPVRFHVLHPQRTIQLTDLTGHREYVQELEDKVRRCERQGVQATEAMQAAAREIANENAYLKELLRCNGIHVHKADVVNASPSSHENLLGMNYRNLVGHVKTAAATPITHRPHNLGHTPPDSVASSQTYSPQRTDLNSGSPGDHTQWLAATPSLESLELQLPAASLPPYHEPQAASHIAQNLHPELDLATAYGGHAYADSVYANLLATSYAANHPATAWCGLAGTMPQDMSSTSTALAHPAMEGILDAYHLPPEEEADHIFAALHGPIADR